MKIIVKKIDDLIFYKHNAKLHPQSQIDLLKKSLTEFGWRNPVLIDKKNNIIAGHGRLLAAKELDIKEVPCIMADDLTPAQIKAYRILDNKSAESEWDFDFLKLELDELNKDGFDMELTGFDPDEIDDIMGVDKEIEEDDFDVDKAAKEPKYKINVGDVWTLGKHHLVCGDSTKEEAVKLLMDGKKADLVFTDPPYGVCYADKNKFLNSIDKGNRNQKEIINDHKDINDLADNLIFPAFCRLKESLSDRASYYITAPQGGDLLMMMMMMQKAGLVLRHMLIWCKNNHVLGRTDYNYKHEPILFGWVDRHKFYGKGDHHFSTWDIAKPHKSDLHPTMKPIELVANAINNSSKKDMIVLDLFGGSGSTLIACEQTNRIAYMMELDQTYISVILERWETLTGKQAIRIKKGNDKIC